MLTEKNPFYKSLDALGEVIGQPLPVTLSPELVGLLSDQLYRSPSKAIEELVVNGFDAEADEARVFVPEAGQIHHSSQCMTTVWEWHMKDSLTSGGWGGRRLVTIR